MLRSSTFKVVSTGLWALAGRPRGLFRGHGSRKLCIKSSLRLLAGLFAKRLKEHSPRSTVQVE